MRVTLPATGSPFPPDDDAAAPSFESVVTDGLVARVDWKRASRSASGRESERRRWLCCCCCCDCPFTSIPLFAAPAAAPEELPDPSGPQMA